MACLLVKFTVYIFMLIHFDLIDIIGHPGFMNVALTLYHFFYV